MLQKVCCIFLVNGNSYCHLAQDKDAGNLTDRIELRKRLKCKSFKWFLDNVYPEKFIPDENVQAYGMVSLSSLYDISDCLHLVASLYNLLNVLYVL